MNEEELHIAIFSQPFEPKLLRLTNGEVFEISRPAHPLSAAVFPAS